MTTNSFHLINSSLQAMPVALTFSARVLLVEKTSTTVTVDYSGNQKESQNQRATKLTALLKSIPGYNHGGINE